MVVVVVLSARVEEQQMAGLIQGEEAATPYAQSEPTTCPVLGSSAIRSSQTSSGRSLNTPQTISVGLHNPPTTKPGNVDPKLCNPVYFTPYSGFVRWF